MNILFLDDSEERQKIFRSEFPHAHRCTIAADAIFNLGFGEWDLVLLDHDLGKEIYADSNGENTGAEVTRWILKNKPTIKRVVVHSFNPSGAEVMLKNLIEAGYNPIYAPFNGAIFRQVLKSVFNAQSSK